MAMCLSHDSTDCGKLGGIRFCLNAYPNATLWPVARDLPTSYMCLLKHYFVQQLPASTENRSCSIAVNFMKHGTLEVVGFAFLVTNE